MWGEPPHDPRETFGPFDQPAFHTSRRPGGFGFKPTPLPANRKRKKSKPNEAAKKRPKTKG